MKTLLIFLSIIAITHANIIIDDAGNVIVDGQNNGAIVTAIALKGADVDGIQRALNTKLDTMRSDAAAALAAAQAQAAKDLAASESKCAAIIAKLKDPTSTKDDAAAEADKTENARKREELLAQKKDVDAKAADLQAQIDALPSAAALKAAKPVIKSTVKKP